MWEEKCHYSKHPILLSFFPGMISFGMKYPFGNHLVTLTLRRAGKGAWGWGWCQGEKCGGSNVGAALNSLGSPVPDVFPPHLLGTPFPHHHGTTKSKKTLALCNTCSAILETPPYYQHSFQFTSKTRPHTSLCEENYHNQKKYTQKFSPYPIDSTYFWLYCRGSSKIRQLDTG